VEQSTITIANTYNPAGKTNKKFNVIIFLNKNSLISKKVSVVLFVG
jgi:hypothetical protein